MTPAPPVSITPDAGGTPVAPAPVVARYDGVLSLTMERSQFVVLDDQRSRENRTRFASTPGFSSAAAPAATAGIRQLLIARLAAALEFGSDLALHSATELEAAIDERWNSVAELRQTRALGRSTDVYERIAVEGLVRADGTAEWGYSYGSGGRALPIPRRAASKAERIEPRSDYELYIQNQMRADLLRMLA
jgi:hypothetical protein